MSIAIPALTLGVPAVTAGPAQTARLPSFSHCADSDDPNQRLCHRLTCLNEAQRGCFGKYHMACNYPIRALRRARNELDPVFTTQPFLRGVSPKKENWNLFLDCACMTSKYYFWHPWTLFPARALPFCPQFPTFASLVHLRSDGFLGFNGFYFYFHISFLFGIFYDRRTNKTPAKPTILISLIFTNLYI